MSHTGLYTSFKGNQILDAINRDDFKKSVSFNKNQAIEYLTQDDTIENVLDFLFKNNGKNNGSNEAINKFLDVFCYTSKLSLEYSKSEIIHGFINDYFSKEYPQIIQLNNIFERIFNKMLDVNECDFIQGTQHFCDQLLYHALDVPFNGIFINLICYHSQYFKLSAGMVEELVRMSQDVSSAYDGLALLTRLVTNKNVDKGAFQSNIVNYSKYFDMVTDDSNNVPLMIKINTLDFLSNVYKGPEMKLSELTKNRLIDYYKSLGHSHPKLCESIFALLDRLPDDFADVLLDQKTTTFTKFIYTKLRNIHDNDKSEFINYVRIGDLIERIKNRNNGKVLNSPETNPFITKLGEIIFKDTQVFDIIENQGLKDIFTERLNSKKPQEVSRKAIDSFSSLMASFGSSKLRSVSMSAPRKAPPGLINFAGKKNVWFNE